MYKYGVSIYTVVGRMVGLYTERCREDGMLEEEFGHDSIFEMLKRMGFNSRKEYLDSFYSAIRRESESYQLYRGLFDEEDLTHANEYALFYAEALNLPYTVSRYMEWTIREGCSCFFLIQPIIEKIKQSFVCSTYTNDELWFCSDWKG